VFVAGILAIRFGFYAIGAPVALIGLVVWSIEALFKGARVAPVLWIAALIAGPFSVVAAGVPFGLGFVAAGVSMLGFFNGRAMYGSNEVI
jgi:hypothetical protein